MKQECGTCRFLHTPKASPETVCRRNPPTIFAETLHNPEGYAQTVYVTEYPRVLFSGWCGEWRSAAKEQGE